jgi:asparagine synthase (glutamine-hydrolysing)
MRPTVSVKPGAGWLGVCGVPDPAEALRACGVTPAWSDAGAAFSGPVAQDASGAVVVCGEAILDNARELRLALDRPDATPGALLAELYRCHGAQAIRHARGMFAVAVWEPRARKMVLLRDGVGARTLYYATAGQPPTGPPTGPPAGAAWFASRLRTLRATPAVSGTLSLPALRNYLTCAFVPGAETLLLDAREVRPGAAVSLPEGESRTVWEPEEGVWDREEPLESAAARLRPLLEDAVQVCLPASSEPVGVFLSGGLDSSLVTALAARFAPGLVHTYAIHFGADYPNELAYSSLVAAHCGTRHRILELPGRRIRETLPETISALDDPIGDPLTTPNLILGRAAAQEVGVILNGEGGDPCFGGPKNLPMLLHELYGNPEERVSAYLCAYQKCYDDLPRLLTPEVRSELHALPPQEDFFAPFLNEEAGMTHYLNRLMRVNTLLKGADHILTKVGNLTAANGLIGRSPLFDRRIVEASFAIPPEYKQAGAVEKAILKRAVADLLPETILARPKSGMLVPVQGWFRKDLRRMARGMLLGRRARIRPYIRQEILREWLDYRGSLWPRHGVKLWLILTLEIWLRAQE